MQFAPRLCKTPAKQMKTCHRLRFALVLSLSYLVIAAGNAVSGAGRSETAFATTSSADNSVLIADGGGANVRSIKVGGGIGVTGRTGQPFSFQILARGSNSATRVSAVGLPPGLTIDALSGLISGTPTQDGSFLVTITIINGSPGTLPNPFDLQITFTSDPGFPIITSPNTASVTRGQPITPYKVTAPNNAGPSDPTTFSITGTLPAGLTFDATTATISGIFTGLDTRLNDTPVVGGVQLVAQNSHGTGLKTLNFLPPAGNPVPNISTRSRVLTDQKVLIGGFIIKGSDSKKVIVRGIGPSLAAAGVHGVLADPTLELHDRTGRLIYSNDNWTGTQQSQIQATGVAPTNALESAMIAILAPGITARFCAVKIRAVAWVWWKFTISPRASRPSWSISGRAVSSLRTTT